MSFAKIIIGMTVVLGTKYWLCVADECDGNSAQAHVKMLFSTLHSISSEVTVDFSCQNEKIPGPSEIANYVVSCGVEQGQAYIDTLAATGQNDPDVVKKIKTTVNYFNEYLQQCGWYS